MFWTRFHFIDTIDSFSSVETNQKFRLLKKTAHLILLNSLEKSFWNWIEFHPQEFAELQRNQNDELSK